MWGDFMEGDHVCGRPRARATTCAGDHKGRPYDVFVFNARQNDAGVFT